MKHWLIGLIALALLTAACVTYPDQTPSPYPEKGNPIIVAHTHARR